MRFWELKNEIWNGTATTEVLEMLKNITILEIDMEDRKQVYCHGNGFIF